MAFNLVQHKPANSASAAVTTLGATLDAAPTEGNLLIMVLTLQFATSGSVATPSGWTAASSWNGAAGLFVFYKTAGAGESATFDLSWTTARRASFDVMEWPPGTVDKIAAANSAGLMVATQTSGTTAALASQPQTCVAIFSGGSRSQADVDAATFSNSFAKLHVSGDITGSVPQIGVATLDVTATTAVETTMDYAGAATNESAGCMITIIWPPLTAGTATPTNRTSSSIEVSWTDASGGTDPITAQLQISAAGAESWSNVSGGTSSPATATGLDDDTEYDFRVAYTDAVPDTVYSATVSATTSDTPLVIITDQDGNTSGIISVMGPGQVSFHCTASLLGAGTLLNAKMEWDFGDPTGRYNTLRGFSASHLYDVEPSVSTDYIIRCTITNISGVLASATRTVRVTPDTRAKVYIDPDIGSVNPTDPSVQNDPYDTIANAWSGEAATNLELILTAGKTHALTVFIDGNQTNKNVLLRSSIKGTKATIQIGSGIGAVIGGADDMGIRDIAFTTGSLAAACRILDPRYSSNDPGVGCWAADITSSDDFLTASVHDLSSGATLLLNVQVDDDVDRGSVNYNGPMVTILDCDLRHRGTERPLRGAGDHILIWDTLGRYNSSADKSVVDRDGGNFLYIGGDCEFRNETNGTGVPIYLSHNSAGPDADPKWIVVERTLAANDVAGTNGVGIMVAPNLQGADGCVIRNVIVDNGLIQADTRLLDTGRLLDDFQCYHVTIIYDGTTYFNIRGGDHLNLIIQNCLGVGTANGATMAMGDTADDFVTENPLVQNNVFPVAGTPGSDVTVYDGTTATESWATWNARGFGAGNLAKAITLDENYRPIDVADSDLLKAAPADMAQFAEDYYGNSRSGSSWVAGAVSALPPAVSAASGGAGGAASLILLKLLD